MMKKTILGAILAMGIMFLFSSCEKEVHTLYSYQVDVSNVTEDGGMAVVTMQYLERLGWNESETIDNDAASSDKAAKENDREAIREFDASVVEYNEMSLYSRYKSSNVQEAKGSFEYTLIRVEDNTVLKSKTFTVDYTATPGN